MKNQSTDPSYEVSTNFKRGTTEMLLLALLTTQDWYVYELSKELKDTSNHQFDIQGPSLYTALYRMQNRGFVSTRSETIGRRTRIYYHILPAGRNYLESITKEYLSISEGVMSVLEKTVLAPTDNYNQDTEKTQGG